MFIRLLPAGLAGLCLALGPSALGQSPLVRSGRPAVHLDMELKGKAVPKWENGFFLTIDPLPGATPVLSVLDASGKKRFEMALAMDGVTSVIPHGLAASPDGRAAITGTAMDAAGSRIYFLAFVNSGGTLERVVRMDKFAGSRVSFAPDGNVWVLGVGLGPAGPELDYGMIRIYNRHGVLQQSLLPRSLMPVRGDPTMSAQLTANAQHVVFYSGHLGYLAVLTKDGGVLSVNRAPLPAEGAFVTGLAISESSRILMSCQIPSSSPGVRDTVVFFSWDGKLASWRKVYELPGNDPAGYQAIFGIDGEDVLVSARTHRLEWVRLPD